MDSFFNGPGFGYAMMVWLILLPFAYRWATAPAREEKKRIDSKCSICAASERAKRAAMQQGALRQEIIDF